ncbi:MAG: PIG-L family deacetylase [Streptosporangiaceae bacterium]
MSRVLHVISPHLDDAALSCCLFMAAHPGSYLTTVFADGPASVRPLTPWDRASRYFTAGADVMGTRRGEDTKAAALIQATARHLPYWDRQYRNDRYGYTGLPDRDLPEAVAEDLLRQGRDLAADGWVIPLGLGHPDHRLAADAALIAAERWLPVQPVYVYEELPYAAEDPAEVAGRKSRLAERGLALEEDPALERLDDRALKKAVFRCHASQRRQLRRRARSAMRTPERAWRLVRAG